MPSVQIGDIVNGWKVVGKAEKRSHYICVCPECGKEKEKSKSLMRRFSSCGCQRRQPVGKVINGWEVLGEPVQSRYPTKCPHCGSRRNKSFAEMKRCISCGCQSTTKYNVGEIVNSWQILDIERREGKPARYVAKCPHCDNIRKKIVTDLESNQSCGCLREWLQIGDVVNGWEVIGTSLKDSHHLVKCPFCSNTREKNKGGMESTTSCGCKRSELKGLQPGVIINGWEVVDNISDKIGLYKVKCPRCPNIRTRQRSDMRRGRSCGCLSITSLEEAFINLMLEDFPGLDKYDKSPLEFETRKRPDFRLEKNGKVLYVNVDGFLYHSIGGLRDSLDEQYHLELRKLFEKNNVTIFQFYQNEVVNSPEIVKSMIRNYFGLSQRIYARSCKIRQVNAKDARQFFEENHLMGYNKAKSFGLYHKENLVCVMSVKKKGEGLDISRFCAKKGFSVVGGFSKLLHHIISQNSPKFIQSFLDLRYSLGHSYDKNSFVRQSVSLGWRWTDLANTFNRLKCRANMDERKLSEKEYAEELKWYKIYDAGQAKYVLGLKK